MRDVGAEHQVAYGSKDKKASEAQAALAICDSSVTPLLADALLSKLYTSLSSLQLPRFLLRQADQSIVSKLQTILVLSQLLYLLVKSCSPFF